MKKLLSTLAVTAALTASAQASVIADIKVGAGLLPSVAATGNLDTFSVENDLGISAAQQSYFYAEFDHLIPIVPNIKYEQTTRTYKGTATQSFTVGTITYSASSPSTYTWDHQDAIFYWGVPFSTWLPMIDAADFGLGLKLGDMTLGIENVATQTFAFGAPYGYARIHVTPPMLFGLGFEFEGKYLNYQATEGTLAFSEFVYKADWMLEAPIPVIDLSVGVELGYKTTSYKITASGTAFDLGYSGIFYGIVGKFGI